MLCAFPRVLSSLLYQELVKLCGTSTHQGQAGRCMCSVLMSLTIPNHTLEAEVETALLVLVSEGRSKHIIPTYVTFRHVFHNLVDVDLKYTLFNEVYFTSNV